MLHLFSFRSHISLTTSEVSDHPPIANIDPLGNPINELPLVELNKYIFQRNLFFYYIGRSDKDPQPISESNVSTFPLPLSSPPIPSDTVVGFPL